MSVVTAADLEVGNVITSGGSGDRRTVTSVREPTWFEPFGTVVVGVLEPPFAEYLMYLPLEQDITVA